MGLAVEPGDSRTAGNRAHPIRHGPSYGRCRSSISWQKGTIEEGMLSVLAFQTLPCRQEFSDGGKPAEISLGGSRLSRFMKDVEKCHLAYG